MTPVEKVYEALRAAGCRQETETEWTCPAHDDDRASLGVEAGDKVAVVMKCQAGCKPAKVLRALGLKWADVMGSAPKPKPKLTKTHKYVYTDVEGNAVLDVYRYELDDGTKRFAQYAAGTRERGSAKGVAAPLWRLPRVRAVCEAGGVVWLCEGEKSVRACDEILPDDEIATTAPAGASQPWTSAMADSLSGASMVNIVADNDLAGFLRARAVAVSLKRREIPYTVWRSATSGKGDDIVDHLAALKSQAELRPLTAEEVRRAEASAKDSSTLNQRTDLEWPPPTTPLACAQQFVERRYVVEGERTLVHWREDFYEWTGASWRECPAAKLRATLYADLDLAVVVNDEGESKPWNPTKARVDGVMDALKSEVYRPSSDNDARVIAFSNGVLDPLTRTLSEPSPAVFNLSALPYPFDPSAASPARWLKFLRQLWKDDDESIALLQEWFGYVLSGDTSLHKMLFIVGPPRSGKSTIVSTLSAMVGVENVVSQPLDKLAGRFSLVPYVGKTLATPGDVRLNGTRDHAQIVSQLLAIVGQDAVDVEMKGKNDGWHGPLGVRFLLVANEMPTMRDDSSALAARWRLLETNEGFQGREDAELPAKLARELPGILLWALDGLKRLRERGDFITVKSVEQSLVDAQENGSDILRFWNENMVSNESSVVLMSDVFERYLTWAETENLHFRADRATFARGVKAAVRVQATRRKRSGVPVRIYEKWTIRKVTTSV